MQLSAILCMTALWAVCEIKSSRQGSVTKSTCDVMQRLRIIISILIIFIRWRWWLIFFLIGINFRYHGGEIEGGGETRCRQYVPGDEGTLRGEDGATYSRIIRWTARYNDRGIRRIAVDSSGDSREFEVTLPVPTNDQILRELFSVLTSVFFMSKIDDLWSSFTGGSALLWNML